MKRYGLVAAGLILAASATRLVAGTDVSVAASNDMAVTGMANQWTPEVVSYVSQLMVEGVPNSGECPLSA